MSKPLRVSWSSLRTHMECKQKSYLLREGKRAKVSNIRNFFHGMVVDSIMREWLDNPLHPAGHMEQLVKITMDELESTERADGKMVRWRDAADRQQVRNFCVDLVRRLEPILQEHVLPYPYEHGKWFKVPYQVTDERTGELRDIVLTGEMDLIVDNDGPVVWDLKGTADDSYYRKVVGQLTFYDLVIWLSSGRPTRFCGLIQPMCKEPLLAWEITDQARATLMSQIIRYCNDVWAIRKPCKDGTSGCNFCDVRHACERYSPSTIDAFGSLADGLRSAAQEQP